MAGYAVVLAVAAGVTLLCTPLVIWLAPKLGWVYHPSARTVHTRVMPTVGGIAMFLGFAAAVLVASRMEQFAEMFDGSSEPLGLVVAAAVMVFVGALDDVRDVSPPAKVAGQVLAAGVLTMSGVTMFYFRVPFASFETVVLSPDLAPLVTILWVVLMANAINLIDGLDGLAAGIVLIGGTAMFLFADRLFKAGFLDGSNVAPLVAIIAVGICLGFLPFNFNPARIFMGDSGAMFLGLLMATLTITLGGRTDVQFSGQTYFFFAPLAIPLLILGVPIIDTIFSFTRRVLRRQAFHEADKDHLHHRLMRLGHGPRRAVVILWGFTAILSGVALVPLYTNQGNALVPFLIAALVLVLYSVFHPGVRSSRRERARRRHPTGFDDEEPVEPEPAEVVDLSARRQAR